MSNIMRGKIMPRNDRRITSALAASPLSPGSLLKKYVG
jgi:hypothetical protein